MMLGVGLAMDAFSVSVVSGLKSPSISPREACKPAGIFAFFQAIMPLIGYFCVKLLADTFSVFNKIVPWISLALLSFIGGKMIFENLKKKSDESENSSEAKAGFGQLIIQGVATSIDALSVGFTIANYGVLSAVITALIIAAVTFVICYVGVYVGKKFGTKFSDKAETVGGIILIAIGLEIFIKGVFF